MFFYDPQQAGSKSATGISLATDGGTFGAIWDGVAHRPTLIVPAPNTWYHHRIDFVINCDVMQFL